jgi:hypothetical protein
MRKHYIYALIAVIAASAAAFFMHVYLDGALTSKIETTMRQNPVVMPPYPFYITAIAFITSFIPTAAVMIIFSVLYERIPGRGPLSKSFLFWILLLAVKGDLIRFPLMNVLVGNPVWLALLVQVDAWISNLVLCLLLGFGIHFAKGARERCVNAASLPE